MPMPAWTVIFLFVLPGIAEMRGGHPDILSIGWDGVSWSFFCWNWPQTMILLISASWVARNTGLSHHTWLFLCFRCVTRKMLSVIINWLSLIFLSCLFYK
jgi:hypothetical protein